MRYRPNKYVTIGLAILVFALFLAWLGMKSANAGLWRDWTTVGPDEEYKVEVSAGNLRVYEWTPSFNEKMTCMFVGADAGPGLFCYEKSADGIEKHSQLEN